MARLSTQLLFSVCLAYSLFQTGHVAAQEAPLTLSRIDVIGTKRLSSEDVAAGLHLSVGKGTTRGELASACARFAKLKLFDSARCEYAINKSGASLNISVKNDSAVLPVVFQNFVWLTRTELLQRLKQKIPLFMPELPEDNGLQSEIIRVLEKVAKEHGIDHKVFYNDFWAIRGMNAFYIEGFSTPVVEYRIEGDNAPAPEEFQKWSKPLLGQNYSAPRLTWVIASITSNFYFSRGYMHPVIGRPHVECLAEEDGTYPVRVIIPVSSGAVYGFGLVIFDGISESHSAELAAKWNPGSDGPFDHTYVSNFISTEILSQPWASQSRRNSPEPSVCNELDEKSKRFRVTISLVPKNKTLIFQVNAGIRSCDGILETVDYPAVP
jgi:outer membrane protein assembly factor BamA